jgi:hypothetical protein
VARLGLLHQIEKIEIGNTSYLVVEMKYSVREMTINDYEKVYSLWKQAEGLTLEESDTREAIALYLGRNPGLCFVAIVSSL